MRISLNIQFIQAVLALFLWTTHPAVADEEPALFSFTTSHSRFTASASDIASISGIIGVNGTGPVAFCLTENARNKFAEFLKDSGNAQARVYFYGAPDVTTTLPSNPGKGCYVFGNFDNDQMNHITRVFRGEEAPRLNENATPSYCPSEDFVKICLQGTLKLESLQSWAKTNGWKFKKTVSQPTDSTYLIAKNGHDPFFITISLISDSMIIECRNSTMIDTDFYADIEPSERAYCDPHTAKLAEFIDKAPKQTSYDPQQPIGSGILYEWTQSNGNIRDYIITSSIRNKSNQTFWLKRLVIGTSK